MAGLEREIKTYLEADDISKFVAFGFNSETGVGENLPGRKIQEAIDAAGGSFVVTWHPIQGASHTFAQITSAYNAGKTVTLDCPYYNISGTIGEINSGYIIFHAYLAGNSVRYVRVNSDDEWYTEQIDEASKAYVDGTRLKLASVSSASWTGAATASIDLDKLTDFGEIPASVTGLTVSVPAASSPLVSQCAFQFSLAASTTFTTLAINLGSTACKIANAPDTWEAGKVYQVTMVNGCAVVGVFG